MKKFATAFIALGAVGALALSGCSSDRDDDNTPAASGDPATSSTFQGLSPLRSARPWSRASPWSTPTL